MSATAAQLAANRENATHSTGPRTPEGKARSARNATRLGLFTAEAFVLDTEREQFEAICQEFWTELKPEGPLEQTHALEIIRASWRLQRCAKIEAGLADALLDGELDDAATDRRQAAVDRARAQSNNTLRRSTAELRRLQTNREIAAVTVEEPDTLPILSDRKEVTAALHADEKAKLTVRKLNGIDDLAGLMEYTDRQLTEAMLAAGPAGRMAQSAPLTRL